MESELERQLRELIAEAEADNDVEAASEPAEVPEFALEWSPMPWDREAWETVTVHRRPILLLQVA